MSFDQDRPTYESNTTRPLDATSGNDFRGPDSGNSASGDELSRRLESALYSPYGIDKLLNRLKQSIFSARELSGFLKERCALEDRHAQGYKKLVRHTIESVRRAEARQGTYARNFDESLKLNERIADNGLAFAGSLHTMSEELRDMADNAERGRKHWKHATIDAEKRLAEAEAAQQKAKDRYNTAAEQYDRVRTGEKQGGKFGLKNKSPAQQEEALKEKADALDQEYATRFETAQTTRRDFENTTRPQIVRALRELIDESDAAVAMQMAKLASVSEKHVVGNGMAIAPMKSPNSDVEPRGLRQIARDIDDRKDFSEYMLDGVEPPPQFKGRSRRNTDAEIMQLPVQRTDTTETPYNVSQSNVESRPPQLPQIGGDSEAFSRSFDGDRPTPQTLNRNSYLGGQSDALSSHPTHQSQQTGVTKDPVPPLPIGRGVSTGPALPPYDRAQASPTENLENNGNFGRSQGHLRQDSVPVPAGRGRTSMDAPSYDRDQGSARQDTMPAIAGRGPPAATDSFADRMQGPLRQDTMPGVAGRGQTDSFGDRMQGSARQDTMPGVAGRGQSTTTDSFGDHMQGPSRQDSMPPVAGRGQSASVMANAYGDRNQDLDRGYGQQGPMPGAYGDAGKPQSPTDGSSFGRGQGVAGIPPVGRGAAPTGRGILPSQQQQQQQSQPKPLIQQTQRPTLPPNRPVFGMHLDDLFRRDGSAVPIIVFQCIQAVDMFGLTTQGIYRVSGSTPVIQQLKSEFDHDSNSVNLTDREMFNNDIANVATLLKNFLRDLPDPLLTRTAYHSFIQAARYEDSIMRRDALHQYINSLPDPNYATLRVLTLHLHRVSMNSEVNMMDLRNLAIVFGPTVMGGGNVADSGLQTKVMETILLHTHDIFDPDE